MTLTHYSRRALIHLQTHLTPDLSFRYKITAGALSKYKYGNHYPSDVERMGAGRCERARRHRRLQIPHAFLTRHPRASSPF